MIGHHLLVSVLRQNLHTKTAARATATIAVHHHVILAAQPTTAAQLTTAAQPTAAQTAAAQHHAIPAVQTVHSANGLYGLKVA